MPIKVTCEKCGGVLHAPDDAGGKKGRCPNCGNVLPIPFDAPRATPAFGPPPSAPSGYGKAESLAGLPTSAANPPSGMAFGSPATNPPPAALFPNADARRPAPFGTKSDPGESPRGSSTPGLLSSTFAPPPVQERLKAPMAPFGSKASFMGDPQSVGHPGWRSVARGLRRCQIAAFFFVLTVLAVSGCSLYDAYVSPLPDLKPGLLKITELPLGHEIRVAAFTVPFLLGMLFLILGRFGVAATPADSMAGGPARLAAFGTLLAFTGVLGFSVIVALSLSNGQVPFWEPDAVVTKIDTPTSVRVTAYLNKLLLDTADPPGVVQRISLLMFVVFIKLAEVWFGSALARIAVSQRNTTASGRVTRCYFYLSLLIVLGLAVLLWYEMYGMQLFRESLSAKWYAMPSKTRVGIVCGVFSLGILLLAIPYWRMLGGLRRMALERAG